MDPSGPPSGSTSTPSGTSPRPTSGRSDDHARRAYALVESLPVGHGHTIALQHARAIVDYYELHAIDPTISMRYLEARLAENVIWWHEHTGTKTLYWSGSHSAVGDARSVVFGGLDAGQPSRNAGSYLREHFGPGYLSAGVMFHHGSVPDPVPAPAPGRPEDVLGRAGLDTYFLDLRADRPAAVRAWLDTPAKMRLVDPRYDPEDDANYHMSGGSLGDWFDVVIYRRTVTPTRPVE